LTDIHEIDSLKDRIARIEKAVEELQDSIAEELEKAGEKPPEDDGVEKQS
jgi:predicted  nucleic acid-binding Zn-ribbon protein